MPVKLVFFDDFRPGVVRGEQVIDVSEAVSDIASTGPHNLINRLIERFDHYRGRIEEQASRARGVALSRVRLRPPVPKPGKIICMAGNYMEDGTRSEPAPLNAFLKSPRAIIGDGDTVVLTEDKPSIVEHEAELALVISKRASKIRANQWREHVFGYLNFIDVSSRGLGAPPMDSFFATKSQQTSAPIGPYLVTADEIKDPHNLGVRLWVSGQLRQDFRTGDMAHRIPELLEWASSIATLEPGDLIATGTNHRGLGPLQDGDKVEMEIEGLGRLRLNVSDHLKRHWPRETRAQREARQTAPRPS